MLFKILSRIERTFTNSISVRLLSSRLLLALQSLNRVYREIRSHWTGVSSHAVCDRYIVDICSAFFANVKAGWIS